MTGQATQQELNRFVAEVDKFMTNFEKLNDPALRSDVYASGNSQLIADYEQTTSQGRILKATIEKTVGAWNVAKAAYENVTGATSTVIGDAIDEIRSWFGYSPMGNLMLDASPISGGNLGALSAIQLPAAAWVAGIVSAAFLLNQTMNKIFISVEASRIQRRDPTISRSQALTAASRAVTTGGILGKATLPLIAAAALAAFLLFRKR